MRKYERCTVPVRKEIPSPAATNLVKYMVEQLLNTYNAGIATVLAGSVAWYLYGKANRDAVKTAAKTIILEIKEAEKIIRFFLDIKNSGANYPTDFYKVTPQKAWDKYSHLFVKKLNNDEYQQVNDFYKKCELLEKFIEKNYNFFWITTEERARQKERLGANYAFKLMSDNPDLTSSPGQYNDFVEKISTLYMSNTGPYLPAGIKTEVDKLLNSINLIINTPTWNKLKVIAQYKDLLG